MGKKLFFDNGKREIQINLEFHLLLDFWVIKLRKKFSGIRSNQ